MNISQQSIEEMKRGAGTKDDWEKPDFSLIPPEALTELALLYTRGAKKYSRFNWLNGMAWSRPFAAMMRHAWAWLRGESHDPETGIHHMVAVAWNAFALHTFQTRGIGEDDRWTRS